MSKTVDLVRSHQFVRSARMPPPPPRTRGAADGDSVDEALESGKAQTAVVGSDRVSFATGVAPLRRQDLLDGSLFAPGEPAGNSRTTAA